MDDFKEKIVTKPGLLTSSHSYTNHLDIHGPTTFGKDSNKFIGCQKKFLLEKTVKTG